MSPEQETRRLIRKAVDGKRVVYIEYVSKYRGYSDRTRREIEPLRIRGHMVEAYCRLRRDKRNFRFDRIADIRLLEEEFSPRVRTAVKRKAQEDNSNRLSAQRRQGSQTGCLLLVLGAISFLSWIALSIPA